VGLHRAAPHHANIIHSAPSLVLRDSSSDRSRLRLTHRTASRIRARTTQRPALHSPLNDHSVRPSVVVLRRCKISDCGRRELTTDSSLSRAICSIPRSSRSGPPSSAPAAAHAASELLGLPQESPARVPRSLGRITTAMKHKPLDQHGTVVAPGRRQSSAMACKLDSAALLMSPPSGPSNPCLCRLFSRATPSGGPQYSASKRAATMAIANAGTKPWFCLERQRRRHRTPAIAHTVRLPPTQPPSRKRVHPPTAGISASSARPIC